MLVDSLHMFLLLLELLCYINHSNLLLIAVLLKLVTYYLTNFNINFEGIIIVLFINIIYVFNHVQYHYIIFCHHVK